MGDPHNPARAGETWNLERLKLMETEIFQLMEFVPVVLSGGWAWHFMSPQGHKEVKTHHDHKDIDIFVDPNNFSELLEYFRAYGYEKARTLYDDPSGQFVRYVKHVEGTGKVVYDVFLESAPHIEVYAAEWPAVVRVVEPKHLLSLYGDKHTSEECLAVIEARKLVAKGISPVGRMELVQGETKEKRIH
jgi:hypothetical protein